MSAPLLTHRPDLRLYHALFCAECWALATRAHGVQRPPTRFVDMPSRTGGTVARMLGGDR